MSERLLGGVCLALAAFFVWGAFQIETGFIVDPLGPKAFPIIIAGVLAVSGLYPLVRPDPEPDWPTGGRMLEVVFGVGVLIAYTYMLPELGFVASSAAAAALLSWRLGAGPLPAAIAGIAISFLMYAIFHLILGLSLARGPWGF
jgi:putative tricarboxylic transport membrane protein